MSNSRLTISELSYRSGTPRQQDEADSPSAPRSPPGPFFAYGIMSTMSNRRFPPPWTIERLPGGFKVIDANGQSLACFYARDGSRREQRQSADHGRGKADGEQLRQAAGLLGRG